MAFYSYYRAIKARLGDLWWYSLLLMAAQRFSDIINIFIGLWLVPRFLNQSQLGAVLPLMQIGTVLGLPFLIISTPLSKILNVYATKNDQGKIKSILIDLAKYTVIFLAGIVVFSLVAMKPIFLRLHVPDSKFSWLIIIAGTIAAIGPLGTVIMQALKRFNTITLLTFLTAPVRLITLIVILPVQALTGYFAGQTIPHVIGLGVSVFSARNFFSKKIKRVNYFSDDGKRIFSYIWTYGLTTCIGVVQIAVESFVIRHRLPELESAAYYIISRFAETGGAMGMALILIAFPLMSEQHEKGERTQKIMWHSFLGSLSVGCLLTLFFLVAGKHILSLSSLWHDYIPYTRHMAVLTLIHSLRIAAACFIFSELAGNRARFLIYYATFVILECAFLYSITGYEFFNAVLKPEHINAITNFNPCRLTFILATMIIFSTGVFIATVMHALSRYNIKKHRS